MSPVAANLSLPESSSVKPSAKSANKPSTKPIAATVLAVQNLTIQAGEHVLVSDLSYAVKQKETLAIVGESGSGKSISSLALLGLLPNSISVAGDVRLNPDVDSQMNVPITQSLKESNKQQKQREQLFRHIRGSRIAMVFQEPMTALNPLHSVGKQIGESLRLAGVAKSDIMPRLLALLDDVNIKEPESKLSRYPHELSGGQRQRVMIAMALAQNPEVLIADEPTTALDVTLQHDILALLDNLKQKHGMAMVLISHDLNLVRRYSAQIIVMQAGKVVEQGDSEAVFNNPADAYTRSLMTQDFGAPLPLNTDLGAQSSAANPVNQLYKGAEKKRAQENQKKQGEDSALSVHVQDLFIRYPAAKSMFGGVNHWVDVVKSVSFNVAQGQALGIVGESGSGKTSIALALTRLLTNQADVKGKILIDGVDINNLSKSELRQFRSRIQMVFQDPFASINPRFTIMQIIEEGLAIQGMAKAERQQQVLDALQTVNLPTDFAYRYAHELSGGQRQRVALARALVMQPQVIILDEPTSALDSSTQVAIVQLLRSIQAKLGLSYIFISHDLKVVQALCQHIMVIKEGECVEYATTHALFANPQHAYSKLLMANR